jgi:FkbM family methyltransferase
MSGLLERARALARRGRERSLMGPRLLAAFAETHPRATFVEIGANDGVHYDHLRRWILESEWRGVMVEPVPHLFERLRRNYEGIDRVALENVAIAAEDGELDFFHPPEGDFDMIGSLSRERTLATGSALGYDDLAERLVVSRVPCRSFDTLCERHGILDLDLLVIDTEGNDFEILRSADLAARRPRLLVYEHGLLSGPDRRDCRAHVEGLGFETREEGFDTWCLAAGGGDALDRAWETSKPGDPGTSAEELGWAGPGRG